MARISKPKTEVNKPKIFNRGFNEVRKKTEKGSKYIKSCYNCEHYYQAMGDDTELCQNPNVLEFDMVNTETSIYCHHWSPLKQEVAPTNSVKGLFKKR